MKRTVTILTFFIFLTGLTQLVEAQTQQLTRISIAERSDGGGLVLRYHLSGQPESHTLQRPRVNLIQMNLVGVQAVNNVELPGDEITQVERVELFDTTEGISIDIHLADGALFNTSAYPDVNGTDLLLSLAYISQAEVNQLVDSGTEIERETEEQVEEMADATEEETEDVIDTTDQQGFQSVSRSDRDRKITFGLHVGLSAATVASDHFSKGFRKGMVLGGVVNIPLPYMLPHNINTSIDTGILYTQKGMEGQGADYYNASSVEFDYLEIPVLAKFALPIFWDLEMYGLIGPSIGFIVSSEGVRKNDGRRIDLDDRTRAADLAFNLGGGFQRNFGNAILYGQLKGSLSIPDVFKSDQQFEPEDEFKNQYIALEVGVRF